MKKLIPFSFLFFLVTQGIFGQSEKSHAHSILLNFQQIDESMNYGLVFRGPGLGYSYAALWGYGNREIVYEGRISFNFPMSKDIVASSFNIVPVRFDYLFGLGKEGAIKLGPYFTSDYNYQMYPDLQSGYAFWFTNFSIGATANYSFAIKKSRLEAVLHTTVMGLTSRQPIYDDPYFFDISFGELMKDFHSDLTFGSWNLYDVTELEIRWRPKADSRLAWAYSIQYYGYYDDPRLTMLNQSVKLMILPKKDK